MITLDPRYRFVNQGKLTYNHYMIAHISGVISGRTEKSFIVDSGSVGYEVFCTKDVLSKIRDGEQVKFFTFFNVREDAQELYGFLTQDELVFYKLLLNVSGIGPRSALNILEVAKPEEIRRAVINQDASTLHSVHGIGKKTAEKLIIELKDKMAVGVLSGPAGDEQVVLEAIINLGYSQNEARQAVRAVAGMSGDLSDKVKAALKNLSRN